MMNIYDIRQYSKLIFLIITAVVVIIFLRVSSGIVDGLATQERERMQIWADATQRIATITFESVVVDSDGGNVESGNMDSSSSSDDIEFLLSIIRRNHTIPVLLADADGNILDHRNFDLPDPVDSINPFVSTEANREFLHKKYLKLRNSPNVIPINMGDGIVQYLYYEDSKMLKRLSYFSYLQLAVMLAFIVVVYFAVSSTKKAEQNKVWVGLSKETAHQLGTPISSLMAWMELLRAEGIDPDIVGEMDKDVNRLSTIASRFSKIGSRPTLEAMDLRDVVESAASYMSTRISSRITLQYVADATALPVNISRPLVEWVLENLIKNAVDAMEGAAGSITITTGIEARNACIEVTDTGKGIPRKRQKTIFNPGYTTKKRGWGLGLTLAKRIVEQYHDGRIFVANSEPGVGTTFRILIPLAD
ncbi:MAG: HAMP domain-containing sensor histidine kinase [Bacteroidales bacterium]|nr:HAMP domain-containing sensor histidine kinase [Bacteroidales bacterium]